MERLGMNEGKEDTKEEGGSLGLENEEGKLDGFEEDRRKEVRRGEEDSQQMAASMSENECEIKGQGKVVVEDAVRPERGMGRQGETNEDKDEGEVKGGNEEEEVKGGGGKKEEERHLSVPSPLPQTRCHYQSASFPLTCIFPILKNSSIFSTPKPKNRCNSLTF